MEGVSEATLYNWRTTAKQQGVAVPGSGKTSDHWSPESKFAVVVETATMSESELSEYTQSVRDLGVIVSFKSTTQQRK